MTMPSCKTIQKLAFVVCAGLFVCSCQTTKEENALQTGGLSGANIELRSDAGTVWFPFAWTVQLGEGKTIGRDVGEPLDNLEIRSVSLLVKTLQGGKERSLKMVTAGEPTSNAALDASHTRRTFYLPVFFTLPENEYAIVGVRADYIHSATQRPVEIRFPLNLSNQPGETQLLRFAVKNGKIAVLPRMAMVTAFGKRDGTTSHVTASEIVDREVLPADIVLKRAGKKASFASQIYPASPDFPRLRLGLAEEDPAANSFQPPVARTGILLKVPCDEKGSFRLVWKRAGDDREYYAVREFSERKDADCKEKSLEPFSMYFPAGEWILRGSQVLSADVKLVFNYPPLKSPDNFTIDYFSLGQENMPFVGVSREKDIQRQLVLRLSAEKHPEPNAYDPTAPNALANVLYLGKLSLQKAPGKDGKGSVWDVPWERTYEVAELKGAFKANDVYNAYTLQKLTRDRKKGQVQSTLKITTEGFEPNKLEKLASELRKKATEYVAYCLVEREQTDPLAGVAGLSSMSVAKRTNTINVNGIRIDNEDGSVQWWKDCLQKKLFSFRFSEAAPANFKADLKFQSE